MRKLKELFKLAKFWVKRNVFKSSAISLVALALPIFIYASAAGTYKVAVVGDMGTGGSQQMAVAKTLQGQGLDEVAFTGDLVYEYGLKNEDDPKFLSHFYNVYSTLGIPLSPALGNHDWLQDAGAWRKIHKSGKYKHLNSPDLYWADLRGQLCQIFLDTDPIVRGYEDYANTQAAWIKARVSECRTNGALMIVAYGHHPYMSSGEHRNAQGMMKDFLEQNILGVVDIYFSGHDHNLEDLGQVDGTQLVVSGAGGKGRDFDVDPPIFGSTEPGYVVMTYSKGGTAEIVFKAVRKGVAVDIHTVKVVARKVEVRPTKPEEPAPIPTPGPVEPPVTSYWKPGPAKSFQILHYGDIKTLKKNLRKVDIVTMELEEFWTNENGPQNGKEAVAYAHSLGAKVVCYTSVGWAVYQEDADQFPRDAMGKVMEDWPDERWGDPRKPSLKAFLGKRMEACRSFGADAVELDNMDTESNKEENGIKITKQENIEAMIELAQMAHDRGLAIMQKNSGEMAKELEPFFDGIYIESCNHYRYKECGMYMDAYGGKGKPIIMLEYPKNLSKCYSAPGVACQLKRGYFKEL